ncbi:MAG: hypothetical protein PWP49_576 [Thermococcaceae archaeon]|jgi:hypothetical protein|uniref:DUF2095 family protein n=1 Tax=Thermococcus TaxID=2263 RepID=UPI0005B295B5|nr:MULTISPECIES: DUF2095 family protein [Thermococcus]KUJ98870.1 MAG: Uncharacterized protein XD43_1465 [Thermococcales archaeon 44_46]MDK2783622.1 hypothetical protein [Thermococcaceae archaeon]MCA6212730.1 DUF2095 domain-containing protein [Thermococcus bergensis]MDK2853289.1 hypothetical protein [Thermococcaceae archaeon]MDK2983476.1 hypothetical protein [Thermococcaceae archaeon]
MVDKKKKRPIDEFPWQEYDKEEFKEKYPHLAKELEEEPGLVIEGYRVEEEEEEELMDFSGYNPTVIDFIRRCETDEEALEIINWMEEHGEITPELAKELRIKLVKEGVRSFGSKKEWGWYEKHGRR